MVFSSLLFVYLFLPITLVLYYLAYLTKKIPLCNAVLLIASMVFYAWSGLKYFFILLGVILANYLLTLLMTKLPKHKKLILVLIIILDLSNLFVYKYFNFAVDNISNIAALFNVSILENVEDIVLPIGISFYTFQIISYVVDVYNEKVPVQKNIFKLALYVMMFPQLIAGPIVRYSSVNEELNARTIKAEDIDAGIKRFILGFAKKVFIANIVGNMADVIFGLENLNTVFAWFGAICYAIQIYYDFSAYSDMAIGIGRMLGFHFEENFNMPYKATSIKDFWRRWHISLSTWFRDYLYIPLGGNRKGTGRTYLNLLIVFILTGFWHGANWTYLVWGLYYGLFLILERIGLGKLLEKISAFFRHLYALIIVLVGWVIFRSADLLSAFSYIKEMFVFNINELQNPLVMINMNVVFIIAFIWGLVFCFTRFEFLNKFKWLDKIWNNDIFVKLRYLFLFIIALLYLSGIGYNPFIYFQF